jgi:hypothetical protein
MLQHGEQTILALHVGDHEARITAVEKDLATIKHWGFRAAIIALLWAVAIVWNMKADTTAELIVAVLKKL